MAVLPGVLLTGNAGLCQKLGCGQHAGLETLGVFGHPLCVEPAGGTRQLTGVIGRMRNGHRGRERVDVERADIELEIRIELLQVEARLCMKLLRRNEIELHRHPIAPLADAEQPLLFPDCELDGLTAAVDMSGEGHTDLRRVASRTDCLALRARRAPRCPRRRPGRRRRPAPARAYSLGAGRSRRS